MKPVVDFMKSTLVGGFLVILPIAVTIALLGKAVAMALGLLTPVAHLLPGDPRFARIVALLVVLAACFLVGLFVRTAMGRTAKSLVERNVLERLPAYTLLRNLGKSFTVAEDGGFDVVLAVIEDALVPAFVIEEHPDGRCTVFVPAIPTPTVGAVYILPKERVHPTNVPFATAVKCITRWGEGSGELLAGMRPAPAR
jgi:uncharacterized membrane protein